MRRQTCERGRRPRFSYTGPLAALLMAVTPMQHAHALEDDARHRRDAPPAFEVVSDEFAIPGVRFHVEVGPLGPVRHHVYAQVLGVSKRRVRLQLDRDSGLYMGDLRMPAALDADEVTVRIVVQDQARRRVQQDVRVPVLSDLCCEVEESCGLMPVHGKSTQLDVDPA